MTRRPLEIDSTVLRGIIEWIADEVSDAVAKRLSEQSPQAIAATEYLAPKQVAQVTGLGLKTLEAMRAKRDGPPFLKIGASVRYRAADVRAWLEGLDSS